MNDQDKSKEQLINELQELKIKFDALKVISNIDISRLNKTESNLQISEAQKKNILNGITSNIAFVDKDLKILWVNKTAAESVHKQPEEMIGHTCHHFWANSSKPCENCPSLKVLESKKPEQTIMHTPDGKIWEERGEPIFDVDGNVIGVVEIATDITERKQAENAIRESEEKFKAIVETSPDGIAITALDGTIQFVTSKVLSMWGYQSAEEILGRNTMEFVHPDYHEKAISLISEMINGNLTGAAEYLMVRKDGSTFYCEANANVLRDNNNNPTGILYIKRDITERKIAEEKTKASEERYANLLNNLEAGIVVHANDTSIIMNNPKASELLGLTNDQMRGKVAIDPSWKFVNEDNLPLPLEEYPINKIVTIKKSIKNDIIGIQQQNKNDIVWVTVNGFPVLDNKGEIIEVVIIFFDITDRKQAEAIFKDIVEKNPMSIQILDLDGYPIMVNQAHTNLFGVKTPSGYSVLNDAQLLENGFGELFDRIKKGEAVYFPDLYYNVHDIDPSFPDSPVWVRALGFTLNDNRGNPDKIVFMHENITERKTTEDVLNDILENNPISIQIVDKEGHTLLANTAFTELFGFVPPPEFSIFDDLSKITEFGNLVSRVKNGEIVHLPDVYYNAHDAVTEAPDIPLWIRAMIFPLKDSAGKPERFVFMHENITERKIAEQELIKAKEKAEESDRLKSAFLANMSHEIRTPMNGILGFAELLKEPSLSGEEQQEYIQIIEKSGNRMLNIINDIVDISKIEAGLMKLDIRETNINEQIEYIYTFFKPEVEAKGLKISFNAPLTAKEATIKTDREKVYAILTNLVKNAIKFSEKGSIELGYGRKGNDIEFFVKDTGIGIPTERQRAIFERFIQADIYDKMARQGAGLGLSISKAYVEMLGGKIWVESQEGFGSTFYFTLPYNPLTEEKEVVGKFVTAQIEMNQIKDLKILIVEDDEISEILITIGVEKFSKEILKARNGLEAVKVCRNNPDIDLILMDNQLPAMNGYEATRQIREFNKDVVIIAQTAYALTGDREKAIETGCNDYLAKPINKADLLAVIQKYFGK
jgi:PAS domain S-box-containing protein